MAGAKLQIEIIDSGASGASSGTPAAQMPSPPAPSQGASASSASVPSSSARSAGPPQKPATAAQPASGSSSSASGGSSQYPPQRPPTATAPPPTGPQVTAPRPFAPPPINTSGGGSVIAVGRAVPTPPGSQAARTAVAPSSAGSAGASASGAAAAGKGLTPAGAVAVGGAAGAAVGAVVQAAKEAIQKIVELSKQFYQSLRDDVDVAAGFNGQVALAQAMSDVRMELAQMNRAEQIGPQLARFEELRGEAAADLYKIVTDLKEIALNVAMPVIELIAAILKEISGFLGGDDDDKDFNDPLTMMFLGLDVGNAAGKAGGKVNDPVRRRQIEQIKRGQAVTVWSKT